MKLLLCLLLLACTACTTPAPVPPSPPPVVVEGNYIITEFDVNGHAKRSWKTKSFKETQFPRRVTFAVDGGVVMLAGSYQIDQTLK